MKMDIDARQLARQQLERDRQRCARWPHLLPIKVARMSASPFGFLRGAAGLFYQLLQEYPALAAGPSGEGWLCGDLHLLNFGAYRVEGGKHGEAEVVFGINDFDEAVQGPWRFDVLRLLTSLILAARELRRSGPDVLALCGQLLDSYGAVLRQERSLPAVPRPVAELLNQVEKRGHKDLLAKYTELHHGVRQLSRGDHFQELPQEVHAEVPTALTGYLDTLDATERSGKEALTAVDAALRIAGTGSLGGLRVAVLVRSKKEGDADWIFDLKEQGAPAAAQLCPSPLDPAARVVAALQGALPHRQPLLGTARLAGLPMVARRLRPQEDKLDLTSLVAADLPPLVSYLGALTAQTHLYGRNPGTQAEWSAAHRAALLAQSLDLAACHEAIYLWYCHLQSGGDV